MSNTLAIGTVTAALKQMLNTVGTPLPGDPPADPDLADAHCTARSLDVARTEGDTTNQLNLFLYQVKEDATFRNMNLPGVHDGEGGQQPLALTLSYVLTAYGGGDEDVLAHRMLGRAMLMLHDRSLMTRDQLKAALPGNDLWLQAERVRIRPLPLGPEEISKLWTGFGKPYRLSIGFEATIVLIESTAPKIAQLPVLTRGQYVPRTPPHIPPNPDIPAHEGGIAVDASLDATYPLLDHFAGLKSRPAARIGEILTLFGSGLSATPLNVTFAHPLLPIPNVVPVSGAHAADHIDVQIPNDPVNWPVGIYTVSVSDVPADPNATHTTNVLPVPLAPTITISVGTSNASEAVLTLTVTPNIRPEQKYALLIDGRLIPPDTEGGLVFTVPNPPRGGNTTIPPTPKIVVRLRVDGIDSLVVADYTNSPPQFDPSQQIDLP